eukprot:TRINITY_DN5721_c0_g1_i1.p1 TRINITY_DN5721_c0_g1~~TRINITY_DN5721_c0_g1_i1.p1  ORF type:complete len:517 (+),score=76.08 TRINITY_DN5721_c0_g1_i1:77-1627(+)
MSKCKQIQVLVSTLNGQEEQFDLQIDAKVFDLRQMVAENLETEPDYLKLISGTELLEDPQGLIQYCPSGELQDKVVALSVMALISLDALHRRLKSGNAHTRSLALRSLAKLSSTRNNDVLDAVIAQLEDPDVGVRHSAVQLIAEIADKGESRAVSALCELLRKALVMLGFNHLSTMRECLFAIGKLAQPGDTTAMKIVSEALQDQEASIRKAAVNTLSLIVEGRRGDEDVLSFIKELQMKDAGTEGGGLSYREHNARLAGVLEAYGKLAARGDRDVIDLLQACCSDQVSRSSWIRLASLTALQEIAEQGDDSTVKVLCRCLNDELEEVKRLAVMCLAKVALPGDADLVEMLSSHLQLQKDGRVREAISCALGTIANPDDERTALLLCNCLADTEHYVRDATVESLSKMSVAAKPAVVSSIKEQLVSVKADARQAAAQVLGKIAQPDDREIIDALAVGLEDHRQHVRLASMDSLIQICGKGDEYCISVVKERLNHPREQVRCTASDTLAKLSDCPTA